MGIQQYEIYVFPLAAFNVCFLSLNFQNFIKIFVQLKYQFNSVQSLSRVQLFQPHVLQHGMYPCLSPTFRACSNSCPSSQWYHPTISSSVVSLSFCLQYFPESGFFPVINVFASGGQSIEASASASVLPMNIQGWFPLGFSANRI